MSIFRGRVEPLEPTHIIAETRRFELDLLQIWQTLWRGRVNLLMSGALGLALGVGYVVGIAEPQYMATAELVLENQSSPVAGLGDGSVTLSNDFQSLNTQRQIIRSRGLIHKLVDDQGLWDDPEFNAEPFASVVGKENIADAIIRNVRATIGSYVQRNTNIISLEVTSIDPNKAAVLANALARLYLESQVDAKYSLAQNSINWLSDKVAELQAELAAQDKEIASLSAKMELTSEQGLAQIETRLKSVRSRLEDVTQKEMAARNSLEMFRNDVAQGAILNIARLVNDTDLLELIQNPQTPTTEAKITQHLAKIETNLVASSKRFAAQKKVLESSLQELKGDVSGQSADLSKMQQLEREALATRVLYETLLARLKEESTLRGMQQAGARVLSPATLGVYQSPKKKMIFVLSLVAGLLVGAAYQLLRQFSYAGFRTSDDLEAATGRPILGQIPLLPIENRSDLLPFINSHPTASGVEAIRNLRTSLLMSDIDEPPQVILSTSAVPGEGKTTHAIALTKSLGAMNRKVLLISGDIRRSVLSNYFRINHTRGIVSALTGDVLFEDAIQHIEELGADVLLDEMTQISASDIFASRRFEAMLAQARSVYDMIIIDSPPVLAVPDARVIARHADAIIFSVAWDRTSRRQVREGLRQFEMVNRPVSGMVLSQINPTQMARYGDLGASGSYAGIGDEYYGSA